MTNAEMVVAIRVTAENAEETIESIKRSAEEMGASVEKVGRSAGNAFEPMKDGAAEAAAAQAALAAAATAAFQTVVGAVKSGTEAYNAYTSAVKGLESIATGRGIADEQMTEALNGVTDAFFSASSAATAYKNLLTRGYSLDQATTTINRLKDAATFGRQASLSLEEAVVNATEGIRNENSILVDNAGVTKNVSKMWEEYAKARGLSVLSMTRAQKVEAEYLGILQETELQVGDLAKASDTLMGAQAEQQAQMTKLTTSFGEAMAPSVQAVTTAGTEFLETMTSLVQEFPALTNSATSAATAFTALVAVLKGIEALKSLSGVISLSGATLGIPAAGAIVAGLATVYMSYATARKEAAQAEEQAAKQQETAREQERKKLEEVNTELKKLYTLYGGNETVMDSLAGAYDSGNDAIVDRIRLLQEEQAALLEKQKAEAEALQIQLEAQKQAQLKSMVELVRADQPDYDKEHNFIEMRNGDIETGMWQQELDAWLTSIKTDVPEAMELARELHAALFDAQSPEEAKEIYNDFFDTLKEQLEETQGNLEENQALIDMLTEAIENPDTFDFDKLYGGGEEGAEEAEGATEDWTKALKDAEDQVESLKKDYDKLGKELKDTKAQKEQVSLLKEQAKEAKKTGKGWGDLSDDLKKFAKQNNVAEGDIDGLINALGHMETALDNSANAGVAELQGVQAKLEAIKNSILSVPELVLSGDASALLAVIDAAILKIQELLEYAQKAGIDLGSVATKTGGGGGGGSKKKDSGGGKSAEEIAREAYDEQIELIEHKRHMDQITLREEIRMLEKVKREYAEAADMVMDIDERIYDARKELREQEQEKITSLYDAITEALEERYEEQREIEQKRIEDSIENWERWAEESTAAIQQQIDALDEAEEAAERAEEEEKHLSKVRKLEASLPFETDEYNRSQIERQIEKAREELQKLYDEWAKEDYRKELEDQMDAIEKKAEEEIEKLEEESERIDTVYDKLTEGASLAAEAQKLLMEGSQEEILDLIASYAPDYEATGRSLGEKLYEGFKKAFGNITKYFESIDRQFEEMVEKINNTAFGETQQIQGSGQTTANVSSPTISQTVNFNQPVESAADVAERMQQVSEDLAAMI